MITSDCPQQQAFMKRLNEIIKLHGFGDSLRSDVYDIYFSENYCNFVNLWCPTFKEYKGAHIVEESE